MQMKFALSRIRRERRSETSRGGPIRDSSSTETPRGDIRDTEPAMMILLEHNKCEQKGDMSCSKREITFFFPNFIKFWKLGRSVRLLCFVVGTIELEKAGNKGAGYEDDNGNFRVCYGRSVCVCRWCRWSWHIASPVYWGCVIYGENVARAVTGRSTSAI